MALNPFGRSGVGGGKTLAQIKALFFDKTAVERAADKAKLRALSKFGAYVRRTAQQSMRYRKSASPPGQPPSAHKSKRLAALKRLKRAKYNGALLREMLFFAYDQRTQTVVVGPLGFKNSPVPALHEFGGTHRVKGKDVRYPARPYMAPALNKSLPKFAESFRGTVSR